MAVIQDIRRLEKLRSNSFTYGDGSAFDTCFASRDPCDDILRRFLRLFTEPSSGLFLPFVESGAVTESLGKTLLFGGDGDGEGQLELPF